MKVIKESEMYFGEFDEKNLFHIEQSKIYKEIGSGVKTVEFVLKYNNSIIFLEAKKSCPNAKNKDSSEEKYKKFEEYYCSITDKFVASLQIYIASILNRYGKNNDIGQELLNISDFYNIKLKFILVIKNADDITWLAGPMAELKSRLLQYRKIWNIEIAVLNEKIAKEYGLVHMYQ